MAVDHVPLPNSWYRAVPATGHTKMVACCDDMLGFEREAGRKTSTNGMKVAGVTSVEYVTRCEKTFILVLDR